MKILRIIIVLIATFAGALNAHAQETGSWRTFGRWTSSGTGQRIDAPDICNKNYSSAAALLSCLNAGGETPALWASSTTVTEIRMNFTDYELRTTGTANTAPGEATGYTIFRLIGSLRGYTSAGTEVAFRSNAPVNRGPKWSISNLTGALCTPTASEFCFFIGHSNSVPPDELPNACLVKPEDQDPTAEYPEEFRAVTWLPVGSTGTKIRYLSGPIGTSDCEWKQWAGVLNDTYKTEVNGQVVEFYASYIRTTGALLEDGEGDVGVGSDVITLKNVLDGLFPGEIANGTTVNVNAGKMMSELTPTEQWNAICAQAGTVSCATMGSTIVQTILVDNCTTKVFWHDGNRNSTGECIGSYDRDWPEPTDTYDPDKAWKWEPGPAATAKDISDGKMTAISDSTGKPVTAGSKTNSGSIVKWPASAGGGNSTNNQGDPSGVTPPETPPGVPGGEYGEGGMAAGNGWYKSQFPGGLGGVWGDFQGQVMGTGLGEALGSYTITGTGRTGDICWTFDTSEIGIADPDLCIDETWINLAKIMMLIGTAFYCRRIVFGG